ncbi:MAG: 3-hydroxyacyl-CoA dehydrogenase NAD-binding domain-containing protein [Myxococcota bacterium]|nr:3-hydroxyacyl-CoA dehydrogenase NAD-binding domain-containing protein [Myxococcota bacterium]
MKIEKVAVIGAGNMGSGIAQKIATEGVEVFLCDMSQDRAESGKKHIESLLTEGIERRIFTGDQVESILSRITPTGDFADLKDVDLVIEAVFEDLQVKQDVFKQLAGICRKDTIFATNTSSFLVADLAVVSDGPERVLGLHYFFHPAKNRLVEVIGHAGTSAQAYQAAWSFQERIAKTPIDSKDCEGFVVNRFFVPWLNEAVRLHEEGYSIATIEAAAKQAFGVGMGPFQLMNVTGIPITLHASTTLGKSFGPFYASANRLKPQVESGQPWDLNGEPQDTDFNSISRRLWGVVFQIALDLVSAGVATKEDVDIGAKVGLRWPLGPFEKMNQLGLQQLGRHTSAIQEKYALAKPDLLSTQEASGKPFGLSVVRLDVRDKIGTITINRPDQLNALNPETIRQLDGCFTQASEDPAVEGIVLAGAGKAFVAGADIKFFLDKLDQGKVEDIVNFASYGQKVFKRLETCAKPVICKLDGMALGGGAELALACHAIVATAKASMAFPETGIGIYPGLGGTQRLTKRLGKGLARLFIYSGKGVNAAEMATLGLAWRVVEPDGLDAALVEALAEAPKQPKVDSQEIPRPLRNIGSFLGAVEVDGLLKGTVTLTGGHELIQITDKIRRKAPQALRSVATLTDLAEAGDLNAGLAAELAGMKAIFTTADAYEGLSSVIERRRPKFQDC